MTALMYHDVVSERDADGSGFQGRGPALYKVAPEQFSAHLDAILTLTPEASTGRDVVITFDDGGVSGLVAADELERRGLRGHFFITTNYIGTAGFLDASGIRTLAQRGHTIGSHSCSHPLRIGHCEWPQLVAEWTESRAILADIIGTDVRSGSAPGGDFAPPVASAAALAGYDTLFTSEPMTSVDRRFGLTLVGRFAIRRWTKPQTAAGLAAGHLLPVARQALAWKVLKWSKRLGGVHYLRLRQILLRTRDEVRWGDHQA
ncbi:MAG TPA: polysaccharide deacetylase family protein [Vicinamibacterales bacterium]|jgi:peptidoglycan/xylan/chitin deacetylase (PgdA/CDA1 family)